MVKLSDVFYYNFLKKAAIIIVILGILIGILMFSYTMDWIKGVGQISESRHVCSSDIDCIEWCGECINIQQRDTRNCPSQGILCNCTDSICQQT
jgi:hypothetical protein